MRRQVAPELLDDLSPDDPRAMHSRDDLKRINKLMGNAGIIARGLMAASRTGFSVPAVGDRYTIVELGAGDGTLLLEIAKRINSAIRPVHAILVDQQSLLTHDTRRAFEALAWNVEIVRADVFEWLARRTDTVADITIANLFLHHFTDDHLARLLGDAARQTRLFFACEPRRSRKALAAVSLVRLIGCNDVTVHDGKISVRAGFRDHELSVLWPRNGGWHLREEKAGRFTHGFTAMIEHH